MSNLAEALETVLDRREYPRVPVELAAQLFIPANKKTWSARVINLSAGGAGLRYNGKPPAPELVGALAIEGFGNLEGITTRRQDDMGGLRFLIGEAERHQLLQRLTALIKSGIQSVRSLHEIDEGPLASSLSLTRQSGRQHLCKVVDISLQGAALLTDAAVPKGEHVLVGRMFGRVIDQLQDQVVVQFLRYRTAHGLPY